MKKVFLRTGALAGLAIATITLASCGGSNEVNVKDLDGKDYKIVATEDSEAVSKALVLASQQSTEAKKNPYAVSADLTTSGTFNLDLMGLTGTVTESLTANAGVSIGTEAFKEYTADEEGEYTQAQIEEAAAQIKKNIALYAEATGKLGLSNFAVAEDATLPIDQETLKALNNKEVKGDAKAYVKEGTVYVEAGYELPTSIVDLATSMGATMEAKGNFYGKTAIVVESEIAPAFSTVMHNYQTKALTEFAKDLASQYSMSSATSIFNIKIDEKFYDSEEYTKLKSIVTDLGVKISKVENGKATFEVDVTGNEVLKVAKTFEAEDKLANVKSKLENDKSLLTLSLGCDLTNGRLTQIKYSSNALGTIFDLVKGSTSATVPTLIPAGQFMVQKMNNSMMALMLLSSLKIDGSLSFELNVKYDNEVTVKPATPKTGVEYQELAPAQGTAEEEA